MKTIIEDTRQKEEKHREKNRQWSEDGIRVFRNKLIVGDYCLPPSVSVDTKQNISEIAANICGSLKERKRFLRECKMAKDIDCELVFLIEDKRYQSIDDLFGKKVWILSEPKRSITGDQLAVAMVTMVERYGVKFMFCDPKDTARMVYEILTEGRTEGSGNNGE